MPLSKGRETMPHLRPMGLLLLRAPHEKWCIWPRTAAANHCYPNLYVWSVSFWHVDSHALYWNILNWWKFPIHLIVLHLNFYTVFSEGILFRTYSEYFCSTLHHKYSVSQTRFPVFSTTSIIHPQKGHWR